MQADRANLLRWLTYQHSGLPWWAWTMVACGATLTGAALGILPILWAAIGLIVTVLVIATLIDPLLGLCIALVLGPTKPLTDYFVPALPLDLGQIALIITLGAWFLQAVRRHHIDIPRSPFNLPLFLFLGAVALSLVNALSLGFALKETIKWAQMILMMWLVLDLSGRRRWMVVIGAGLSAAALEAAIGVWQFGLRGDGPEHFLILDGRFYRAYGTFEQPNPYGGFLGLLLPIAIGLTLIALEGWIKPVWDAFQDQRPINLRRAMQSGMTHHLAKLVGFGALAGLIFAALMMSWSRGAWLGFGAAAIAIVFVWPRKWWLGAGLVIGGGLAGLLALQAGLVPASIAARLTDFTAFLGTFDVRGVDINDSNYAVIERLAHWQAAREMARFNPWLGVGFGNYEPVYPGYRLLNWAAPLGHAHNYYLNLLAEVGIIGLLAYTVLWVSVIVQTWRATRQTSGWARGISIGLMGTWVHLSVHHLVDKLYVANLYLHIGALLGVLSILLAWNMELEGSDRESR